MYFYLLSSPFRSIFYTQGFLGKWKSCLRRKMQGHHSSTLSCWCRLCSSCFSSCLPSYTFATSFQSSTSFQCIERSSWYQARREPADVMRRWVGGFSNFSSIASSKWLCSVQNFTAFYAQVNRYCCHCSWREYTMCTEGGIEMDTEVCDEERRVKSKQSCSELFFFMSSCRHTVVIIVLFFVSANISSFAFALVISSFAFFSYVFRVLHAVQHSNT